MRRREFMTALGGAAAAWPLGLRAQQKAMPVIGILTGLAPNPGAPYTVGFHQGLRETGYVEGQNVAIESRWTGGRPDRVPALVADLVGRKVDVIVTSGPGAALAFKNATPTIPIVFSVGIDPVATGLVASLARPGGNLTGITRFNFLLMPKRLELLSDLVQQAKAIALLANPDFPITEPMIRDVQEAARAKGVQLLILKANSESAIDAAFATVVHLQVGGLLVAPDVFFFMRREPIFALASRHAVPVMYDTREYVAAGGLISYAPSPAALGRQLGIYVGKILNGAKPADLPVEQPTRFELVINLKTANALGLTIPQSILARADEVIE
jgi:putative tryptophan/tyrosine transport system substrate-binding protein